MDQLVADQIRKLVTDGTGTQPPNTEPWPGCPIGHIPIDPLFTATLDAMVAAGEVVIVERPATTNPNRVARFVAFA